MGLANRRLSLWRQNGECGIDSFRRNILLGMGLARRIMAGLGVDLLASNHRYCTRATTAEGVGVLKRYTCSKTIHLRCMSPCLYYSLR